MTKGRLASTLSATPVVACTKAALMVFNFAFWISGIAVLALGVWTKVQLYVYMELSTVYYQQAPYILIGVGAGIVLVGSFGCCCTAKGNDKLLYLYSAFLILVFACELGTGAAGFAYKNKLETGFKDGLTLALKDYGSSDKTTTGVNGLQSQLHCCGKEGYADWFPTAWAQKQNGTNVVPKSCCRDNENTCKNTNLPDKAGNKTLDIFTDGCFNTVTNFMQKNMGIIGGVALGISFMNLLGALLACCLAKSINRSKYEQVQ